MKIIIAIVSLVLINNSFAFDSCTNKVTAWAPNYAYSSRQKIAEIACKNNVPLESLMVCLDRVYQWASNWAAGSRAKVAAIACSEGAPLEKLMICLNEASKANQAWAQSETGAASANFCKGTR